MSHHILEFRNVSFSYPDGYKALDNVSFIVHHGESLGLIGANGAGKSTILLLIVGILFPEHGDILLGDVRITKKNLKLMRQKLGMIFQNSDDQLFMPTLYDDIAFGPRNYKLDEDEVKIRVENALDEVGIRHLENRASYRLSGGEKRAAAIATVLSMTPDVLLMDEPTSTLDPKSRRRLINILKDFKHIKIITSHDLDMIYEVCDRVIVINNGKIETCGSTKDVLTDKELLNKCNLEIPLSIQNCLNCGGKKKK